MTYESAFGAIAQAGRKLGFHPIVPLGTQDFLRDLLSTYTGRPEGFEDWFLGAASLAYRSLNGRPRWLQDPEWPMAKGRPMVFVGQIDKSFATNKTSFYVFWDQEVTGATRVIVQVLS